MYNLIFPFLEVSRRCDIGVKWCLRMKHLCNNNAWELLYLTFLHWRTLNLETGSSDIGILNSTELRRQKMVNERKEDHWKEGI